MNNPSPSAIRHIVVLAHPDASSFNAAIAATYCEAVREAGQKAVLRDLYRMQFDPVLRNEERPDRKGYRMAPDVSEEWELLAGARVFTFIFPIWFGMPPAMMTGYVDRVLGAGVTSREIQQRSSGNLLGDGHLCTITTSGASEDWLDAQGQSQALRELTGTYLFRGFAMRSNAALHIGDVVEGVDAAFIRDNLDRVRSRVQSLCARVAQDIQGTPAPSPAGDDS
ncbi:NAD(P)H-dependent oxidoreductase [Sphingobium sp. LB126]|uniref:NAD(P)H-dependent oxidoreductase n=1 Tax=Sphingobium sp. LB126 TaxID=1983755 RepID=UPI0012FDAD6D|nr:NAD(P)H-dependent oxidoreductase [Sphingobium sp. LB126]